MWIKYPLVGIKRMGIVLCILLIIALRDYQVHPFFSAFLLGCVINTMMILAWSIVRFGLVVRRKKINIHHESYQVCDTYYVNRSHNTRGLYLSSGHSTVSEIFTQDHTHWAYFESFRILLASCSLPKRPSVLVLGGGAFAIPKTIYHAFPSATMDVVEKSTAMIDIARTYFLTQNELEKISIIHTDAQTAIVESVRQYDIIVIDLFTHSYVEKNIFSKKFIHALSNIAKPNTVILMNLGSRLPMKIRDVHALYKAHFSTFSLNLLQMKTFIGIINASPTIGVKIF